MIIINGYYRELHGLVEEGRRLVHKEVTHAENLMKSNLKVLKENLENLSNAAQTALQEQLYNAQEDYHVCINIVALLELIEINHVHVVHDLCDAAKELLQAADTMKSTSAPVGSSSGNRNRLFQSQSSNGSRNFNNQRMVAATQPKRLAFQLIGSNAADFFMMSSYLEQSAWCLTTTENELLLLEDPGSGSSSKSVSSKTNRNGSQKPSSTTNETDNGPSSKSNNDIGNQHTKPIELARLYKIAISPKLAAIDSLATTARVYAIIAIDDLKNILTGGWTGILKNGKPKTCQLFSTDACKDFSSSFTNFFSPFFDNSAIAAQLYEDHDFVKSLNSASSASSDSPNKNPTVKPRDFSGRLMLMIRSGSFRD